jgi:hypothetical protein
MGCTPKNLDVFIVHRDKNHLEGTAYFELHPGELPAPLACWLPGSAFVRDAAFDFLVGCFERSNPKFDYSAFERFDRDQVERLLRELDHLVEALAPGCSRDAVFSMYNSLFRMEIWDGVDTELLRAAVARNAVAVAEFIRDSRSEDMCLWVLGM